MQLPWRLVKVGDTDFDTSLTYPESDRLVSLARDQRVLEVGTAYGYSACIMGRVAQSVLSVDPHGGYGSVTGSLPLAVHNVWKLRLEHQVQLVVGSSYTFLPHLERLGAHFDLIFIDGDHRASGVRADLQNAWRLLEPGGRLVAHDYGEETCPEVAPVIDGLFPDHPLELVDTLWTAVR